MKDDYLVLYCPNFEVWKFWFGSRHQHGRHKRGRKIRISTEMLTKFLFKGSRSCSQDFPSQGNTKQTFKKTRKTKALAGFDRWRLHGNLEWLSTSLSLKPKDKTKVKWNKGNTQIRTYSYNQEGFGLRLGRFSG